jgi:hypothetical protein
MATYTKANSKKGSDRETNSGVLRQSMMKLIERRLAGHGELEFPCIPSLCESYVMKLVSLWGGLGRPLTKQEAEALRDGIRSGLTVGFEASPFARLVVNYVVQPQPAAQVLVSHFRDAGEIRAAFLTIVEALAPGGLLVFNAFLPVRGYEPDAAAKQMSQTAWSSLFTPSELDVAVHGLPLDRVSDESAYEFERVNGSPEAWPPTPWFESWSKGQNVFDLPLGRAPIELRWLVYQKTDTQRT